MKIVIASVRDTGGTGWNLAHAINKVAPEHQAVDMTAQKSYIDYPMIVDMGNYSRQQCRKMIYCADVIVFLGAFKPLIEGLKLKKAKLRDKKKVLLFMGSEWRYSRKQLLEQAETLLKQNYAVAVGGPGMFLKGEDDAHTPAPPNTKFLPPCRSFSEIKQKFGICNQDEKALQTFAIPKRRVVFMHAPTSEITKGSETFYRAVTKCMQLVPELVFSSVRGQPWVKCLRSIAVSDVLLDQNPPFPEAYGAISIEAGIFHLPVVSQINSECIKYWLENEGLKSPIITWKDDDDLLKKFYLLATNAELRHTFGEATYRFMKALHDEKPVVERFLKIADAM